MEKQFNPGAVPGIQQPPFPDVTITVTDPTKCETPIMTFEHAQPHHLSSLLVSFQKTWKIEISGNYEDN